MTALTTVDFTQKEIEKFLHSLRLGKYETKAYLMLLKHGPQDYKGLIRHSDVPYGKIYSTLKSLTNKGWIRTIDKRPKIFSVVDPEVSLENHLMIAKGQVALLEKKIRLIFPKLKALYNRSAQKFDGSW